MIRNPQTRNVAPLGRVLILIALLLGPIALAGAETVSLESSSRQVALLELYTSEGCSSCPPADRWLSTLKTDDRLWTALVPIAFHVDYWDYIGWSDRFASTTYSARQRNYVSRGYARTVYTPGLFLNGNEWRSWFGRRSLVIPSQPQVGVLKLTVRQADVQAQFDPARPTDARKVFHLAVLGINLRTNVKAGENRGRELQHDFVVLGYQKKKMENRNGRYQVELRIPESRISAPKRAIAGWISLEPDPRPVQAVGGWLN